MRASGRLAATRRELIVDAPPVARRPHPHTQSERQTAIIFFVLSCTRSVRVLGVVQPFAFYQAQFFASRPLVLTLPVLATVQYAMRHGERSNGRGPRHAPETRPRSRCPSPGDLFVLRKARLTDSWPARLRGAGEAPDNHDALRARQDDMRRRTLTRRSGTIHLAAASAVCAVVMLGAYRCAPCLAVGASRSDRPYHLPRSSPSR